MTSMRTRRSPHRTLYAWTHAAVSPAAEARRHLRGALAELNVASAETDEALVMVSELVSNAHLYADGPYELRLRTTAADIIVEVRDRSTTLPPPVEITSGPLFPVRPQDRGAGADALLDLLTERGRGLQIVHALSLGCWGIRVHPGFKIIWFALDLPCAAG